MESVLSFAAAQRRKDRRGTCRPIVESRHLIREHCQSCLHFDGSACSLLTSRGAEAAQRELVRSLVEPSGVCPMGAWPPPVAHPISRMNLVYFIFPLKHPDNIWQWNVDQLLQRIASFNGRKIVTVATGDGSLADRARIDSPEAVMDAFSGHEMKGHEIEFRLAPNNPACGEAEHFLPAMRMIASTEPGEALFYAHAKGVTRPKSQLDVILRWTSEMYQHNLDRIDEVRELLPRWPCVGIAKSYGYPEAFRLANPAQPDEKGSVPFHGWHYAGTFWWVRHDALFSRPDWDRIEIFPHATERYLGNFFRSDEAICLAHNDMVQPYDMACWQRAAA